MTKQQNFMIILLIYLFYIISRLPPPSLPTWQDCHELWSKRRRRQLRDQQESMMNLPPGKPAHLALNEAAL